MSSVSTMTPAEVQQPPSNDPEEQLGLGTHHLSLQIFKLQFADFSFQITKPYQEAFLTLIIPGGWGGAQLSSSVGKARFLRNRTSVGPQTSL